MMKNTQIIATQNRLNILKALHRFGWLRTRDIAKLIWTDWKRSNSAMFNVPQPDKASQSQLRMAQRTLKYMTLTGHVLSATAVDGSIVYGLSAKGAAVLVGSGLNATSGKDQLRACSLGYFRHRCICNEISIAGILEGYRVSTEREIARGAWKFGKEGLCGKCPDIYVKGLNSVTWVEVERSKKNQRDYQKLLSWLGSLINLQQSGVSPIDEPEMGFNVIFVCTKAFEQKLRRDLGQRGHSGQQINFLICFKVDLYKLEVINVF